MKCVYLKCIHYIHIPQIALLTVANIQQPNLNFILWYCWFIAILGPLQKHCELGCVCSKASIRVQNVYHLKYIQLGRNDSVIAQEVWIWFYVNIPEMHNVHSFAASSFRPSSGYWMFYFTWIFVSLLDFIGSVNWAWLTVMFCFVLLFYFSFILLCFLCSDVSCVILLNRINASTFISLCLCVCHLFHCYNRNMTKIQIGKKLSKVESCKWNTNEMKTFSCFDLLWAFKLVHIQNA